MKKRIAQIEFGFNRRPTKSRTCGSSPIGARQAAFCTYAQDYLMWPLNNTVSFAGFYLVDDRCTGFPVESEI